MITTRKIDVNLSKGRIKLNRTTTKNIDASIKVKQPKKKIKSPVVSTHNMADIADIIEKRKRDEIMAERTSFQKNMVIYQNEQNELMAKEKKIAMKKRMAKARAAKRKKK